MMPGQITVTQSVFIYLLSYFNLYLIFIYTGNLIEMQGLRRDLFWADLNHNNYLQTYRQIYQYSSLCEVEAD